MANVIALGTTTVNKNINNHIAIKNTTKKNIQPKETITIKFRRCKDIKIH